MLSMPFKSGCELIEIFDSRASQDGVFQFCRDCDGLYCTRETTFLEALFVKCHAVPVECRLDFWCPLIQNAIEEEYSSMRFTVEELASVKKFLESGIQRLANGGRVVVTQEQKFLEQFALTDAEYVDCQCSGLVPSVIGL